MQSPSFHPSSKQQRKAPKSRLTPLQLAILILFGVLGAAALGAVSFLLLAPGPASPVSAAQTPSASPRLALTAAQPAAVSPSATLPISADCAKNGSGVQAGEARVIDGQTLEVQLNGQSAAVHFAGVKFPAGSDAAAFLESVINGQPVILVKDVTDQDADGRYVRYVFAGKRFINEDLIRQGYARADYNTADRACIIPFQLSEQQARIDRLGIWQAAPAPTATFMPLVTLDASQQSCDCSKKYTCDDFKTHSAAQTCFNACNDYSSKLDENHNGKACENLP